MDMMERLAIEADCAKLIYQFMWHADKHTHKETIPLFTQDCLWEHPGGPSWQGHEGMNELFDMLVNTKRIQRVHPISNILVDVIDEDNAQSKALCLHYGNDASDPALQESGASAADADGPIAPFLIAMFDCEFKRTDEGWRIHRWTTYDDVMKP